MNEARARPHPALAWFHRSFGARVVALFLALLAIVQIASFGMIKNSLRSQACRELPEALAVAERVMLAQLDAKATQQAQRVRVYGADFGLHTVVTEDAETISSLLEENATDRTGADEAALLGPDLSLRASYVRHIAAHAPRARRLAAAAERDGSASEIVMLAGSPHRIVIAPVKPPNGELLGWLLMSFRFEPSLIDDMRFLSKLHFTLMSRDSAGAPWRLALSSLAPARAQELAAATPSDDRSPMLSLQVDAEELGLRVHRLAVDDLSSGAVLGVVSASIDEAIQVPRRLQFGLLATTLVAFGLFAVGSLYTARRVTTPLRRLARAAERLGSGDYDTPVGGIECSDEIGDLAQSFESMRVSVAEKQAQILRLAYWDTLTGLPNRARFRDAVMRSIADASEARTPTARRWCCRSTSRHAT